MGRTIPTATALLRMEQAKWKPFRNQLSKKDRPLFDEMLSLSHMFNYAIMYCMPDHPFPVQPILMSILLYHYKDLSKIAAKLDERQILYLP